MCVAERNALVEKHLPLVYAIANRMRSRCALEFEDLVQEGTLGLIDACERFVAPAENPEKAFAVYASTKIRGAMLDRLRRPRVRTEALADHDQRSPDDTEQEVIDALAEQQLLAVIRAHCDERQARVLVERYFRGHTFAQVARSADLSPSAICVAHRSGLRRVKAALCA